MSELWTNFELREVLCDLNVSEKNPRNPASPLSLLAKIVRYVFLTMSFVSMQSLWSRAHFAMELAHH